ncbi:glucose 1-dehydrogenase [Rhodococcus sp. JVH1]|uniref:glucose 1-dehydrogenase n=1 Tax=Rhodococcus sp. JVH1 TaxID=745408 RepID=UPI0002720DAE|nr:glucose 1-dehydrogenase [Rhodococcus sp. JVH1]EJI98359.1 3-alpha-(or 20-beta)-hydroxysteroid dehydrogenase [Rhodococcus sp. JVH1]
MGRLSGKVAVVTGGSRGMGASHVRFMVREGAMVVFSDLLEAEGKALADELGKNVAFVPQDVTKADDWGVVIRTTEERFGHVNVLVNNAGIAPAGSFEETTEEQFRRTLDINLIGTWLGIKSALVSMRAAGGGSIINISSAAGIIGNKNYAAYTSSKFGVRGLTKAAAAELGRDGIRVNSVHPGMIATTMLEGTPNDLLARVVEGIPLGRVAQPEEVSNLVLFLASDESSYSTGSEFIVDAGVTAI